MIYIRWKPDENLTANSLETATVTVYLLFIIGTIIKANYL